MVNSRVNRRVWIDRRRKDYLLLLLRVLAATDRKRVRLRMVSAGSRNKNNVWRHTSGIMKRRDE